MYRIASQDFTEHEQGLLSQQLKMLRGRTQSAWVYIGEVGERDLTLSPNRTVDGEALADLRGGAPMRLEWPLRMFGLITLLQECEARLSAQQPAAAKTVSTLSARLGRLREPTMLWHGTALFHFLPEQDQLFSNLPSLENALQMLCSVPADVELQPIATPPAAPYEYSARAVLWSLALQEQDAAVQFDAQATYRIGAWPSFGQWASSPALTRLAALYSRDYASLAQGAAFASLTQAEVAAFLHACQCCGLGLQARVRHATPPDVAPAVAAPQQNLLQRLRNRLGLSFKRA